VGTGHEEFELLAKVVIFMLNTKNLGKFLFFILEKELCSLLQYMHVMYLLYRLLERKLEKQEMVYFVCKYIIITILYCSRTISEPLKL
jgi:hypothetical protein